MTAQESGASLRTTSMVSASLIVALALVLPLPVRAKLVHTQCNLIDGFRGYGACSSEASGGRQLILIRHLDVDKKRGSEMHELKSPTAPKITSTAPGNTSITPTALHNKALHISAEGRRKSLLVGIGLANFTGGNVSEGYYVDKDPTAKFQVEHEAQVRESADQMGYGWSIASDVMHFANNKLPLAAKSFTELDRIIDDILNGKHTFKGSGHVVIVTYMGGISNHFKHFAKKNAASDKTDDLGQLGRISDWSPTGTTVSKLARDLWSPYFSQPATHPQSAPPTLDAAPYEVDDPGELGRISYLFPIGTALNKLTRELWSPFLTKNALTFTCKSNDWSLTWPSLLNLATHDERFSWLHKATGKIASEMQEYSAS